MVTESGEFKSSALYRNVTEDFVNYGEVVKEVEAQYLAFVALVGRKPDYFEGHAVASAHFFKALQAVAAKHECDYLPLGMNATTTFKHQPLAVFMDSMNPDYDPFETLQKCVKQTDDTIPSMLVLHPGYVDEYLLQHSSLTYAREMEVNMILDSAVQQWLQNQNVNLISYRDIH